MIITACSLVAAAPLAWWYSGVWLAAVVPFGLAGIWHFHRRFPILVDPAAMVLALAAAGCWVHGLWPLALILALAAGTAKETAPVFAALYAWHPALLVGLIGPAIRHLKAAPEPTGKGRAVYALQHPILASRRSHAGRWTDLTLWALPWGVLLAADVTPQVALTLAAAYAQCLIATDTVRLYQWAWPVLAAHTAIPRGFWLAAAVAHLANPWKSDGS